MIHGIFIKEGLSDWQIVQHENGFARVDFSGEWILIKDAVKQGIEMVQPKIRVCMENFNSVVIDWVDVEFTKNPDSFSGEWHTTLDIPAGGLYRIETGLYAKCVKPGIEWTFRGDEVLHVGVGNIFVIAGQSNAAGYAKDITYDEPKFGVHLFRNRGSWDIASHPLNEATFAADVPNAERGNPGVSPFLAFGKTFMSLSGLPVGLIQTSMGGLPIRRWGADNSSMYVNMVDKTKRMGRVAGILWYQGCSDTDIEDFKLYKQIYYNMINRFREAVGYEVPFFTFQLNRQINGVNDEGWGVVRDNQRTAAHDINKVYVIPTSNEKLCDCIHNCGASCINIGNNMARLCANVLCGKEKFFAPDICEAYAEDDLITIKFDNVSGAITTAAPEYKKCGFTVCDESGEIFFERILLDKEQPDTVKIKLDRKPVGKLNVSFAWQADPTCTVPFDSFTFLPILSFYKYDVMIRRS